VNALSATTGAVRARGGKGLVAFLTAGFPTPAAFEDSVRAAAGAGCDVIEVGIPFSDPIADGPVIQAASTAALAQGMTLARALESASRLSREVAAPLVFMSYLNPILRMGVDAFAARAAEAGVAGVILPDVSFEESTALRPQLRARGMAYVDLVAPTSGDDRIRTIAGAAEGFVYLVSLTGVTGARAEAAAGLPALVARVRAATATPVYVGFGISGAEQARDIARHADGVIIGSRLLQLAAAGEPAGAAARVGDFLAGLRRALEAG
jgi:tryptophan synthase alpha chain